MSFKILTDSSCNLTAADATKYNVGVISFVFTVGGKDFRCFNPESDPIADAKRFYDLMRIKADIKTSLINADKLLNAFETVLSAGEDVLFIGISAGISGTMQAARFAAEEAGARYPERKCVVIDSSAASLGQGMVVMEAARMRDEGRTIYETATALEQIKFELRQEFTIDTLYHLKKSGRVSALASFAGSMLNIKPILYGSDMGTLEVSGKVRGRMKAITALADSCAENLRSPQELICITHGDCEKDALLLQNLVEEKTGAQNFMMRYFDLCTGAHVGPGTLAIFYFSKNGRKISE